ncbi:non-specific serine/threonine protein kinase [Entamoeba marina]
MSQCYRVGQFVIGKKMGEGVCGKVYLAFHEKSGVKVAIKIVDKTKVMRKPEMKRKIEREIAFLKLVDHVNILKLYTVYETTRYLFLVMELMEGGELFDYIDLKGRLETDEVLKYFQQIIQAIEHFHSRRICHRDLKPENVLLSKDLQTVKICDFGMSAYNGSSKLRDGCGSPHYAAPEVCARIPYDGCIADIWSCGVILYVMTFGMMPFDDDDLDGLLNKVRIGEFQFPRREIKHHPFYTKNNPDTSVLPTLLDDGEPVKTTDSTIITTLCYLLNNVHITEIRENLHRPEPNTIRAFYRLLEQHRKNADEDPFAFSRNNSGPQSLKSTIFAIPGSSPSNQYFSPAFSELASRNKVKIQHIQSPKPNPSPIQIRQENESLSSSSGLSCQSPLMFSMPKETPWGFVCHNDVQTSETLELDCSPATAQKKLEMTFNELGIVAKKNDGGYSCEYKYMEDDETKIWFDVDVQEGDINEISIGFGEVTVIKFTFTKGDVTSFSDVYNVITKVITTEQDFY